MQARRLPGCLQQGRVRRAWQKACLWLGLGLSLVASAAIAEIRSAEYGVPTDRYGHGVLGDAIEWGTLELRLSSGKRVRFTLPQSHVFEDLAPRLVDLDLDGDFEVVVVESSNQAGGRLAIYDETGRIAATPYIGRVFRWLAPIGAADLDGDGYVEVAYIDRPHLAKTLRIWRFQAGALTEVAQRAGLTNHRIGEDFISGGLRDCGRGPELVTADANWQAVVVSRFDGAQITSQAVDAFTPDTLDDVLNCR